MQDPGNVGAIVRVAEAAGATGVVAAGASADPFGWKALRGSMGSALRLPIVAGVDRGRGGRRGPQPRLPRSSPPCRATGGRCSTPISTGPLAILIGGEGQGLPRPLVDAADERVTIPMQAPVESLNAAVTAALIALRSAPSAMATKTRKHRTHASCNGR